MRFGLAAASAKARSLALKFTVHHSSIQRVIFLMFWQTLLAVWQVNCEGEGGKFEMVPRRFKIECASIEA